MGISADESGIFLVREASYGIIPTNPAFVELPIVSESLATNANTITLNALNPYRQLVDNIVTGLDVSGNLEIEVARTTALDLIMESAFAEVFDKSTTPAWKLSVGTTKKSFTIIKRWPDPAGTPGVDYLYHIYQGCVVNTMTMTMSAGDEVTASIAVVGKEVDADTSTVMPVGATFTAPTAFNVLSAPEVQDIVLDNVGGSLSVAIGTACVTDMVLTMNANALGVQCLGTLGNKETVLGRFESTLAMTIFFNSNDIMEEFLSQGIVDATFTIGDNTTSDHYAFTIPRGKISAETVVVGGTGTDVVNTVTVLALIDNTLTPPSSLILDTSAQLVAVTNVLEQWTSSENLLSGSWRTNAGFAIDTDDENSITVTTNGNIRCDFDQSYPKGTILTMSFDIVNVDVVGDFSVSLIDNFVTPSAATTFVPGASSTRFAVTIDSSGMIGSTVESFQLGVTNYSAGTAITLDRIMFEDVTNESSTNPSSYVPNSVSKQLNSYLHQPSTLDPGVTVANGACGLMDQDGWCWGTNGLWTIAGNVLDPSAGGVSLHALDSSILGRTYNYHIASTGAELLFSANICGNTISSLLGATSPVSGSVVGGDGDDLFLGSASLPSGLNTMEHCSIVELDSTTGVDGVAIGVKGALSVDPITLVVTE